MYTSSNHYKSGARAYAMVATESGAMSATPHQLITMLFDGAKTAIIMARHHMLNKDLAAKGAAISKAINIVESGLKASLDADAAGAQGAELVGNLSALYDYIVQRLLFANLRNDPLLLDEADQLLASIGSAWLDISPDKPAVSFHAPQVQTAARLSIGV